ncbi:hypothetical protein EJB05_57946, partial [Eragrostis curvula]
MLSTGFFLSPAEPEGFAAAPFLSCDFMNHFLMSDDCAKENPRKGEAQRRKNSEQIIPLVESRIRARKPRTHSPSPTPEKTGSFRTREAARVEISRFLARLGMRGARVLGVRAVLASSDPIEPWPPAIQGMRGRRGEKGEGDERPRRCAAEDSSRGAAWRRFWFGFGGGEGRRSGLGEKGRTGARCSRGSTSPSGRTRALSGLETSFSTSEFLLILAILALRCSCYVPDGSDGCFVLDGSGHCLVNWKGTGEIGAFSPLFNAYKFQVYIR